MHRSQVYRRIDGERDYQNKLPSSRTDGSDKTVGDYVTMMGHYYNAMLTAWTKNNSSTPALDFMRKIAGIAVHCMEDHGAPVRVPPYSVTCEIGDIVVCQGKLWVIETKDWVTGTNFRPVQLSRLRFKIWHAFCYSKHLTHRAAVDKLRLATSEELNQRKVLP